MRRINRLAKLAGGKWTPSGDLPRQNWCGLDRSVPGGSVRLAQTNSPTAEPADEEVSLMRFDDCGVMDWKADFDGSVPAAVVAAAAGAAVKAARLDKKAAGMSSPPARTRRTTNEGRKHRQIPRRRM